MIKPVLEGDTFLEDVKRVREHFDQLHLWCAKNNADSLVYQTEKALRDLGDKVPSAERGEIESKINDLKTAAQSEDLSRIQKASESVQQTFHALSQQLDAQGQGQPQPEGPGGPSTPPSGNGAVIDGEVKE